MKTPLRLVWSEGMFISPQHLQSLDRYHEALLDARLGATAPFSWGVQQLELDGAALGAGQLRLDRFAGVFPGGLALAFTGTDPEAPPPRTIAEHFPPQARSLEVHLAVARERDGLSAYAPEGADAAAARARFTVMPRPVQDASSPGATVQVPFARPNVLLLLGSEAREDFDTLKIAELARNAAGQVVVSDAFVPPLLRAGASPWLAGALKGLLARLIAKQRELAAGRRPAAAEIAPAEAPRMLQLVILGGAIPELVHVTDGEGAPPAQAYVALARLAGQLAAFSPDGDVAGLPKFNHADPRGSFEPILARLDAYLGGIGIERFVRVPLEPRGAMQIARFADEKLLRGQLFLTVKMLKGEVPEAQVAEQLPRLCKIAALSEVQALVQAAAPGLPLQYVARPPAEIPPRAGVVVFGLAPAGADRLWKSVLTDRTLAMYLPPPFDAVRAKVELLAVPPPA